jgi:dGTPase
MQANIEENMMQLRAFMFENVYYKTDKMFDRRRANEAVYTLYEHLTAHPENIPPEYTQISNGDIPLAACDYIATMDDNFALSLASSL